MGPQQFLELVDAMASLAELNALYYRQLLDNGFTPEQALELVKVMVATVTRPQTEGGN